jgi:hypothetical protein
MKKRQTSIKGIIIPAEWDKDGKIIRTAVVTFNEDRFLILNNRFSRTLFNHLRKTVTITGNVTIHGSLKMINVNQFHIH